jgi:NTE family protein
MVLDQKNPEILALVSSCFKDFLGIEDPESMLSIWSRVQLVDLPAGDVLLRHGDPSDAIYLVLNGRLSASLPGTPRRVLGEIGRGEMIGEMGVIQGTSRSADVEALRDSILLKILADDFRQLLDQHPHVAIPMVRSLLKRIASNNEKGEFRKRVINICLLPLDSTATEENPLDMPELIKHFAEALSVAHLGNPLDMPEASKQKNASVAIHLPEDVDSRLLQSIQPGLAEGSPHEIQRHLLSQLEHVERNTDFQLLVAQPTDSIWTRICLRQADVVLVFASSTGSPQLTPLEKRFFSGESPLISKTTSLCLVHPADQVIPRETRLWLEARPYLSGSISDTKPTSHYHLRHSNKKDMARLARIVSGNAIGLVLAGGGARGFVQVGIIEALEEAGVEWDYCGGTSMGSYIAGASAMGKTANTIKEIILEYFADNPTSDYNWLPTISIVRGKKREHLTERGLRKLAQLAEHEQVYLEDSWKPVFFIATNYSQVKMQVLRQGLMSSAIVSSSAIPAALPPEIWRGDILIDGGVFNNYPVDVMFDQGARYVIGVTMEKLDYRPVTFERIPSPVALLWDRLVRPKNRQRYRGVPSISTMVFRSVVMASIEHQRRMHEVADLSFNPTIRGVGMLDWKAAEKLFDIGFEYGRKVLNAKLGKSSEAT